MVAIKSVTLFSVLAALVAAAPAAQDSKALTAEEILAPYAPELAKREAAPASVLNLSAVTTLLLSITSFLTSTLVNLGTLNLDGELSAVGDLLTNITTVVTQLVNTLTGVTVGTGLAATLNTLLINTGLKTLLNLLLTIVNQLVSELTGKTLSTTLINVITSLRDTLNNLSTVLGSAGLGDGVTSIITSIVNLLNTLL
ncbi:uncharacterized protein SAPINGB_P004641 [Magnusiomyces paraingens]|uniref:Uncharacterized protein n=1 Tax=Magnusiomyces paraingens TaxID=2606893 RepID=A0A5E8BXY8_9ASCO|nr:uncharacterized protein SAPINGB_P004641 [Saprochaete ingens]VVT55534.1 unnamed protein product [Saprochaete ingens]